MYKRQVYDEHGILHGEDARRFHEYLSRDPTDDVRTQYLESSKRAYAIIEKRKQEKTNKIRKDERVFVLDYIFGELQAVQTEAEGKEVVIWIDVQGIFEKVRKLGISS